MGKIGKNLYGTTRKSHSRKFVTIARASDRSGKRGRAVVGTTD